MNISDDIRIYFVSEAWNLFLSYLESLEKAMERNDVNSEKQREVFDGIIDYVDEYVEELNVEKLSYNSTLNLLEDLGSPSEVLFAMDLLPKQLHNSTARNSPTLTINCRRCNTNNPLNSNFCEICGTPTTGVKNFKSVVSQQVIDHPYSSIFICSYFIFVLSGVIYWTILNLSDLFYPVSLRILLSVSFSPIVIIGSLIIALVFGYFLNFFLHDLKSETFKVKKLLNSLEDNFAIALLLIALAVLLLDFLISAIISTSINGSSLSFFVLFLLIGGCSLTILGLGNYMARPEDPDLFSLLKTKKIVNRRIRGYLIQINLIILINFVVSISIIPYFITQN